MENNNENKSLLTHRNRFVESLTSRVVGRLNEKYIPSSFDELSDENKDKLLFVDRYYQLNIISREMAIQIMSSIIECEGWINRFREYNEDLLIDKLKEISELLWLKRKNLFIDLEMGIITKEIFSKINSEISRFEKNNYVNNLRMAVIMDNPQNIEVIYNKSSK